MCYIEVGSDGVVSQGADVAAYKRARAGESRLFAVWPGQWRSDLFQIDDLDEYERGTGMRNDPARTGLADHVHDVSWGTSKYGHDNPRSPYVSIEVVLRCGCKIEDIGEFAAQMRKQSGWDVATSTGWSGSWSEAEGHRYTVRVRRKSLD